MADRITVLRDGTIAGHWQREEFDEPALAAAIASQRGYDPDAKLRRDDFGERKSVLDHWFKGTGKPL
jgi:ABC-type sugar transport system ATPase subunit